MLLSLRRSSLLPLARCVKYIPVKIARNNFSINKMTYRSIRVPQIHDHPPPYQLPRITSWPQSHSYFTTKRCGSIESHFPLLGATTTWTRRLWVRSRPLAQTFFSRTSIFVFSHPGRILRGRFCFLWFLIG
jgi:hypothetical protein